MKAQERLSLLADIPEDWSTAALARRRGHLETIERTEREQSDWNAWRALRCAHLWLAAGLPGRGDDLVLEADELAPQARLIPDWWGLWPEADAERPMAPEGKTGAEPEQIRALAGLYLELRHAPPQPLLEHWQREVTLQPERLDDAELRVLLGVLIHGRRRLDGSLEQVLAETVGEELVARAPALTFRLFEPLCERLPGWSYARIKAADLALNRGELERCRVLLAEASTEQTPIPWLHDIAARLALAQNDVMGALEAWQQAMAAAAGQAELVELFRQRAREARRGPGVLQARSLVNRGEHEAAMALLEALLAQDPQWQPLRSLLEQARPTAPGAPTGSASGGRSQAGPDPEQLAGRLKELASRAGLAWPPEPGAEDPAHAEPLDPDRLERFLQEALGRLALLG